MGEEACLYILLGTYPRLTSPVDVLVFLSCDFHVSNLATPLKHISFMQLFIDFFLIRTLWS